MLRNAPCDERSRPIIDGALTKCVGMMAEAIDDLGYVDPLRILFVCGAARRESSASVRPLSFGGSPPSYAEHNFKKPRIHIDDRPMSYEICLRPKFFLKSTPETRLEILLHELWHISPTFDGTLAADRSHRADAPIEEQVRRLADRFRTSAAPETRAFVEALFSYSGELRMRAWKSRPPSREPVTSRHRDRYDERDLYSAIIEQS